MLNNAIIYIYYIFCQNTSRTPNDEERDITDFALYETLQILPEHLHSGLHGGHRKRL